MWPSNPIPDIIAERHTEGASRVVFERVIEIMPPAVDTDMTVALSEGVTKITLDEFVKLSFKALKTGESEILPGQAKQLAFMRRLAPNFIGRMLWKTAKKYVPAGTETPALRPADGVVKMHL